MSERSEKRKMKKTSVKNFLKLAGILILCIYVTCVLVKQQIILSQCDDIAAEKQQAISEVKLEQEKLQDEYEKAGTDEYVESAAREKLGLVKANERVFIDIRQE